MSEAEVRRMRTAYYGMISEVDDHLGRVIGHLKETGQYDNTLIVFTCDHGEQLGTTTCWVRPATLTRVPDSAGDS